MSKKIMLIALCIGIIVSTSITPSKAQVKFGPIAGFNFNDVVGADANSDGMSIRFHLGALVNFGITNSFMIEPQLLYSVKGAKGTSDNLNLSYIEIPIWVRYQMGSGLNFNAGPYVGVLLGAKSGSTDVKDNFKTTDIGLGFGLGYQMDGGLGFAANYSFGATSIGEDQELFGQTYSFDAKTTCIKLSVSYTLGGKRE
jgi:hypothetical protein